MKNFKQSGSHVLALSVLVLVLGAVAFSGYTVMNRTKKTDTTQTTTTASTSATVPKTVQTKADLTATAKSLDGASSDLNSGLDDTTLNSSMNQML